MFLLIVDSLALDSYVLSASVNRLLWLVNVFLLRPTIIITAMQRDDLWAWDRPQTKEFTPFSLILVFWTGLAHVSPRPCECNLETL